MGLYLFVPPGQRATAAGRRVHGARVEDVTANAAEVCGPLARGASTASGRARGQGGRGQLRRAPALPGMRPHALGRPTDLAVCVPGGEARPGLPSLIGEQGGASPPPNSTASCPTYQPPAGCQAGWPIGLDAKGGSNDAQVGAATRRLHCGMTVPPLAGAALGTASVISGARVTESSTTATPARHACIAGTGTTTGSTGAGRSTPTVPKWTSGRRVWGSPPARLRPVRDHPPRYTVKGVVSTRQPARGRDGARPRAGVARRFHGRAGNPGAAPQHHRLRRRRPRLARHRALRQRRDPYAQYRRARPLGPAGEARLRDHAAVQPVPHQHSQRQVPARDADRGPAHAAAGTPSACCRPTSRPTATSPATWPRRTTGPTPSGSSSGIPRRPRRPSRPSWTRPARGRSSSGSGSTSRTGRTARAARCPARTRQRA